MTGRDRDLALQRRAMRDWLAMMGGSSPGARCERRGSVVAAVVPASPDRSIANSVSYDEPADLIARLDELAALYDEAQIDAWTVWVPEFEIDTIAALERAGHAFDGKPLAMTLELDGFEPPDLGGLDYDDRCDMPTLGEVNQSAYGLDAQSGFAAVFASEPEGVDLRVYRARDAGEVACVLATIDHEPIEGADGPDCGIYFVATFEGARGRGFGTRLLAAALVEARGRGCATSTLQASAMGEPIYAGLGYRAAFRWNMYERRRAA